MVQYYTCIKPSSLTPSLKHASLTGLRKSLKHRYIICGVEWAIGRRLGGITGLSRGEVC